MKRFQKIFLCGLIAVTAFSFIGCQGRFVTRRKKVFYDFPEIEAEWIRDGQPLTFEGKLWHPENNVDVLLDDEVHLVGIYRGVEVFIDKVDVRPYERLYTKFGVNRFRSYRQIDYD